MHKWRAMSEHISRVNAFAFFLTLRGLFLEYISTNGMLFTTCHSHGCYSDSVKVVIMLSKVMRLAFAVHPRVDGRWQFDTPQSFSVRGVSRNFCVHRQQQINMTTTKKGLKSGISSADEPQDSLVPQEVQPGEPQEQKSLFLSAKMSDSPPAVDMLVVHSSYCCFGYWWHSSFVVACTTSQQFVFSRVIHVW